MQIKINALTIETPTKLLFTVHNLTVNAGEKIGFVAPNGTGKTTFFEQLYGASVHATPKIQLTTTIGYLPQKKVVMDLSGGEEVKSQLLGLLTEGAGLLLLDEPSVNLDRVNHVWLANTLQKTATTVIFSSHDRALLNQVAQKIWYLEREELKEFVGTYPEFLAFQQNKLQKEAARYEAEQRRKAQLLAEIAQRKAAAARLDKNHGKVAAAEWKVTSFMGSYDGKAKAVAKTAKVLERRLEKEFTLPKPEQKNRVRIATVGNLKLRPITLLHLKNKTISQGARPLFHLDDFKISYGQHLVLTGANGSGKTTLLNKLRQVATGDGAEPDTYRYEKLSLGVFEQKLAHFSEDSTLLAELQKDSLQSPQTMRNLLGTFGFRDHDVLKKVSQLSGGEKVRFALARVLLGNHHLLLLDEPSNYLDLDTMQALENFLVHYPGTFLLVSHDEELVKRVGQSHWQIADGKLTLAGQKTLSLTQKQRREQRELLEFQKDQLMLQPDFDLAEVRKLSAAIDRLQGN